MNKISLQEAFRQGTVKIGDYIDYQPKMERCVLTEEQTGWCNEQAFKTEQLKWRFEKIGKDIILIADRPTTAKVFLRGKIAYGRGISTIDKLCEQLYLDSEIGYKAKCITSSIQEKVNKCNIRNMSKYWLGNCSAYGADYKGIWLAVGCICYGRCYAYVYVYSNGKEYSESLGVRPVVYLKPDVQIMEDKDCDGSEEKPWKFFKVV